VLSNDRIAFGPRASARTEKPRKQALGLHLEMPDPANRGRFTLLFLTLENVALPCPDSDRGLIVWPIFDLKPGMGIDISV
jgi:hypothetical protein